MSTFNCLQGRALSTSASDLVQFDADSIRQIAKSRHAREPNIWVVDPERYEQNGRILRDSESARMLAYSKADLTVYATDGCNSCARQVPAKLRSLDPAELRAFADENGLPVELLQYLVSLL